MTEWRIKGRRPKFPDEAWVKKQVKDQLKLLNSWYYMPNGGYYSTSGIPDFVGVLNGLFVGVETKDSDGTWSQAQRDRKEEIVKAKGCYILVDEDGLFELWTVLRAGFEMLQGAFFDLRGADKK